MLCGRGCSNGELRRKEIRDKGSARRLWPAPRWNQNISRNACLRRFNGLMCDEADRASIGRAVQVAMHDRPGHRRNHNCQQLDCNNDAPSLLVFGMFSCSLQFFLPVCKSSLQYCRICSLQKPRGEVAPSSGKSHLSHSSKGIREEKS